MTLPPEPRDGRLAGRLAGRLVGVDVARCLALLGMMATHILPGVTDGEVPLVQQAAGGRASALFAVLAGVSLVLVTRSRAPLSGPEWRVAYAALAARAGCIGLVGLLLGEVDSGIAVILAYYAVLFVLAGPFLAVSSRVLIGVLVGWVVLAPLVSFGLRQSLPPPTYDVPAFDSLRHPLELAIDLVVTGYYPTLTWLPYLLLGILVGRLELRSVRTGAALGLSGLGAAMAAVVGSDAALARPGVPEELTRTFTGAGWQGELEPTLAHGLFGVVPTGSTQWLLVRAPHSGTTFDLLVTGGIAVAVLAGCLLAGRVAAPVLRVACGAGAMTLTLYSLHVVLRAEGWWDGDDWATFLGQALSVLAIGAVFAWRRTRGPLETVVGRVGAEVGGAVRSARPTVDT